MELTLVIVLLGVLSVSARALFTSQETFAAALLRDQLVSTLRLTQQAALAKNDGNAVSFTVSSSSDIARFDVNHLGTVARRELEMAGSQINWSTSTLSGDCTSVTGTLPHSVNFDGNGETTTTLFCITGNQTQKVCLSALGFAYEGDCDT